MSDIYEKLTGWGTGAVNDTAGAAGTEPETPSLREHRHICAVLDCGGDCVCGICGVPFATSNVDDWVLDPSREEQLRASAVHSAQPAHPPSPSSIPAPASQNIDDTQTACDDGTCGVCWDCRGQSGGSYATDYQPPAPAGLPTPYTKEELDATGSHGQWLVSPNGIAPNGRDLIVSREVYSRLRATARLAVEARQDRERLDWLEAQGVGSVYLGMGHGNAWQINPASLNFRAAIDAARTTGGEDV